MYQPFSWARHFHGVRYVWSHTSNLYIHQGQTRIDMQLMIVYCVYAKVRTWILSILKVFWIHFLKIKTLPIIATKLTFFGHVISRHRPAAHSVQYSVFAFATSEWRNWHFALRHTEVKKNLQSSHGRLIAMFKMLISKIVFLKGSDK